jgi:hypothetical protein
MYVSVIKVFSVSVVGFAAEHFNSFQFQSGLAVVIFSFVFLFLFPMHRNVGPFSERDLMAA